MRLTEEEKNTIIAAAQEYFGSGTIVVLYGSRVDDRKKGGDIDLLIVPEIYTSASEMLQRKIRMIIEIEKTIGEQKMDILIKGNNDKRKIVKTALEKGIQIC